MDELTFEDFKERYQHVPVEEYPNRVCEAMPDPVVSVHIGTYQHVDFIRDCIEGILMQETDFPFEIVIGEDESDDGTREICKEYAGRHPEKIRLLLHRRENNIAIHGRPTPKFQQTYSRFVCRGKYIALCQGDDYWTDPLKLQKQVDFLEANPEYVLSHHDAKVVDASGDVQKTSALPNKNKRTYSQEQLMCAPFLLTMSLCYRNIINRYPNNFMGILNADLFLVSMLGKHGKGKYQKRIAPSGYRNHKESMWTPMSWIQKKESLIKMTRELFVYHDNKNNKKVSNYHKKMLFKGSYLYSLRKKEYGSALTYWFRSIDLLARKGEFGELFSFLKHSVTMFLGSLKLSKNE